MQRRDGVEQLATPLEQLLGRDRLLAHQLPHRLEQRAAHLAHALGQHPLLALARGLSAAALAAKLVAPRGDELEQLRHHQRAQLARVLRGHAPRRRAGGQQPLAAPARAVALSSLRRLRGVALGGVGSGVGGGGGVGGGIGADRGREGVDGGGECLAPPLEEGREEGVLSAAEAEEEPDGLAEGVGREGLVFEPLVQAGVGGGARGGRG